MKLELVNKFIEQATQKAYANVNRWMGSDVSIASQLRDGIRTALSAFDDIDTTTDDVEIVLEQMLKKVQAVLAYYRSLPGDAGTWECSALSMIQNEIMRILDENLD